MARLFVKYLWIFGPLCQRTKCTIQRKRSNFCQILNKPSKIAQDAKFRQSCKILRNLVTLLRLWVSLGSLGSSQSQCFIFYFLSNSTISLEGSNTFNSRWLISLSFTFSVFLLYKFSVFSLLSSLLNLLSFYLFTWTNWRLLLYCFCFLIPTCQTFYYLQHVGFLFLYFALLLLLLPTKSQCFEPSFLVLFPMWIRYPVAAAAAVVVNTNESLFVENNFLPHKNPLVVFVPSYR